MIVEENNKRKLTGERVKKPYFWWLAVRFRPTNNLPHSYYIIKMTVTSCYLKVNDVGIKHEQNSGLWVNPFSDVKESVPISISNQYFHDCLWPHSLTSSNFILLFSCLLPVVCPLSSLCVAKMLSVILVFWWQVHSRKNNCWEWGRGGNHFLDQETWKGTWWIFSPGLVYSSLTGK